MKDRCVLEYIKSLPFSMSIHISEFIFKIDWKGPLCATLHIFLFPALNTNSIDKFKIC